MSVNQGGNPSTGAAIL